MHHTKVKADIGLAKVIADLTQKGNVPCIPLSEHQPYDLVVVVPDGKVLKVQVKYARLEKNGFVNVKTKTSWADGNGIHTRRYKESDFDYYAIYCPDKEVVVYIPNEENCPRSVRFEKTRNNQMKGIKWAETYLDFQGGASETTRRTSETTKT